jgi:hypothetical protein
MSIRIKYLLLFASLYSVLLMCNRIAVVTKATDSDSASAEPAGINCTDLKTDREESSVCCYSDSEQQLSESKLWLLNNCTLAAR